MGLPGAEFKEFYLWDRLLEENDIQLLYQKTYLPYKPVVSWNDLDWSVDNIKTGKPNTPF